jgi:GGDEF domain-containing protein
MRQPYGGLDQYYAFTARLAAAGHQATAMGVVRVCLIGLSLAPLLAAFNPASTIGPRGQLVLAAIFVACGFLAVPWLRYRWPSRTQSMIVVVIGSIAADPMAGMLIAVAFSLLLCYTTLFHNARLLAFVSTLAALTIASLAFRIAAADVPTAFAVVTPTVLLDVVLVYILRIVAKFGGAENTQIDVEPVTGLLSREAFYERCSALLGASNRNDDRYLVIGVIAIDNLSAITGIHGDRGSTQVRVAAGQALRETVRHSAVVGHLDEAEFLVADAFTTPDPAPLIDRILGAIAATPSGITASIGVVSTPLRPLTERPPYEVMDQVITLATEAMAQARRGGGNQARYRLEPDLHLDEDIAGSG